MKISQLISLLAKAQTEHGDLNVSVETLSYDALLTEDFVEYGSGGLSINAHGLNEYHDNLNPEPQKQREIPKFEDLEPQVFSLRKYIQTGDKNYLLMYRMWAKPDKEEFKDLNKPDANQVIEADDDCDSCRI